jgi:uncharacterized protein (TIRG00374 family)
MKKIIGFSLKTAISGLLLYLALRAVDFTALQQRLLRLDAGLGGLIIAVLIMQYVLLGMRWRLTAAACNAVLETRPAILFTFIGMFFTQVLPSTVGGDAARIWFLARSGAGWKNATYSVLVDRVVGLTWLAIIVLVCLPWSLSLITNHVGRITLLTIGIAGCAGPLLLFAIAGTMRDQLVRWRLTRHALDIADALRVALASRAFGVKVSFFSVTIHLLTVLVAFLIAKAIDAPLTASQALLLVPPVTLISAIPLSIAGWGVRESAMVAAFSYAGLSPSDGLAISVLSGIGLLIIGAIGGIVWLSMREKAPA